ncbi:Coatomer subunit [Arachis hypogaea]|nr:Coatomer subunit [Arachis hypogaea]
MSEVELDLPRQTQHDNIPVQSFTPEQTKEAFDVARNSIELLSTVLSSPQQDVLQVYPKAAESLAEPEEYPNLFEDWQVALAVESKAAETRANASQKLTKNGEEQYREAHEEHNGEEGSQEEAVVVDANSTDGAILVNGNEAEEEWDEISKGGFSNDCLPSNNSAFWFSKATFERFVRSVSKCCRLKKKSCRLKVHFKQMLCRCPVHLPMREVQALAKEAAETVVLGH